MNILSWLADRVAEGFHGSYLLIFTLVIWLVFLTVLFSNPRNKLNQWCFFSGLLCSVGTLKEYLFYELGPQLIAQGAWTPAFSEMLYSLLSAAFYYLSLPTGLVFGLYFSHAERDIPRLFPRRRYLCYLPALLMAALFPCTRTLELQSDALFCLSVALYEWLYGILLTILLVRTLRRERLTAHYRQSALVAVSVLLPLWMWLITSFPYHALGVATLTKAWQLNLMVLVFVLLFLLYHAFREGIWGVRFKREAYDWRTGEKVLQGNAHFISHALKNDLAKIDWCVDLMRSRGIQDKELDIIQHATDHLKEFAKRTRLYSDRIDLHRVPCDVAALFDGLREGFVPRQGKEITLLVDACDAAPLLCDSTHLEEVLHNLISNAEDAIAQKGCIRLSYRCLKHPSRAVITVTDDGCGMAEADIRRPAEPFFTTKKTEHNMGLGLYYCWNVMEAHRGQLLLRSTPGQGSAFSLVFPCSRMKKGCLRRPSRRAGPDERG